jgi:hypothetical protein
MKEKIKGFKYTCNFCGKEVIHESDLTLPEGWFQTEGTSHVSLSDSKGRPVLQVRTDEHFCSLGCHSESVTAQVDKYESLTANVLP